MSILLMYNSLFSVYGIYVVWFDHIFKYKLDQHEKWFSQKEEAFPIN